MYYLRGNKFQLEAQKKLLTSQGIVAELYGYYYSVIPNKKAYVKALILLWITGTIGWWHYKEDLIKYKVCSEEQYMSHLNKYIKGEG